MIYVCLVIVSPSFRDDKHYILLTDNNQLPVKDKGNQTIREVSDALLEASIAQFRDWVQLTQKPIHENETAIFIPFFTYLCKDIVQIKGGYKWVPIEQTKDFSQDYLSIVLAATKSL